MLVSQYLDAMVDVADRSHTNVLYMPSNPGGMQDLFGGMRDVLLSTQAINNEASGGLDREQRERLEQLRAQKAQRAQQAAREVQQRAEHAFEQAPYGGQQPQAPQQQGQQPQNARQYFDELRKHLKDEG